VNWTSTDRDRQIQALLGRVFALESRVLPVLVAVPSASTFDGAYQYANTAATTEGPYWFDGTAWRQPWNMPWGYMTSATVTSSQTGISTLVDVTNSSITFTGVANRNYRLSAIGNFNNSSTANNLVELNINTSGNTRLALGAVEMPATGAGVTITVTPWCIVTPGAGSVTYKLRAQAVTSGTVDLLAGGTAPMIFMAEDIGPSGAPT
jgi:hypothetical protein